MTSSELIPATVLSRKAVVYVRQSTQSQVMSIQNTAIRLRHAQPAACGRQVCCGIRQSMPSIDHACHDPVQPEQQAVVDDSRIVGAIRIDDQGTSERAQIDEMMPIPPVACQARGLDA